MPCGEGVIVCAAAASVATDLIVDALDMQYGDYRFIGGPLYFNFNGELAGGGSSYTLEHINYDPEGWEE